MPNASKWNELPYIGGGGGGDCNAIIDVIELPTENIRDDCFYRLLTAQFLYNQYVLNTMVCYCVESLPAEGYPALSGDLSDLTRATVTTYYNVQDGVVYGYVPAQLAPGFGVPAGWYPADVLMAAVGFAFGGVITDILEDPRDSSFRLLLETALWSYKDGKWISHKTIGMAGTGHSAERFNHPSNVASGDASHAEGDNTTASGDCAHAEGEGTTARGSRSHAEGQDTAASGYASHAEGDNTTASGYCSHAEGDNTTASGDASHAEGEGTTASGYASHVQGKYNIEDTEEKYAHIVGNGITQYSRSNAHTLDWSGLGWFAGGLKVGGMGQDDPKAEEILTKSQVQALIDEAIAKLNL